MDGLAVFERHDAQDALAWLIWQDDLPPKADATVTLRLAPQGIGHHRCTKFDRQIGPLSPDLLVKVARGAQPSSPIRSAAINASCGMLTLPMLCSISAPC